MQIMVFHLIILYCFLSGSCRPNKRIKGTKPAGHESGISLLLKVLAKLTIVARILAPYAQGR